MKNEELIRSLKVCGGRVPHCEGCVFRFHKASSGCYDQLKLVAAKELEILTAENNILHGRRQHDETVGADATA